MPERARVGAGWVMGPADRERFLAQLATLMADEAAEAIPQATVVPPTEEVKPGGVPTVDGQEAQGAEDPRDVSTLSLSIAEEDQGPGLMEIEVVEVPGPPPTIFAPLNRVSSPSVTSCCAPQLVADQQSTAAAPPPAELKQPFAGLRMVVEAEGRAMGKRRAQMLCSLIQKHGGVVQATVQGDTTHVITCLGKPPAPAWPAAVQRVTPEWVSASVLAGEAQAEARYAVPAATAVDPLPPPPLAPAPAKADAKMLTAPAQSSSSSALRRQDELESAGGFVPVFFGMAPQKGEGAGAKEETSPRGDGCPVLLPTSCPAIVPLTAVASHSSGSGSGSRTTVKEEPKSTPAQRHLDWIAKVKPFACQRGVKRLADGAEGDEAKDGGTELPGAGKDVNQFVIEELTKLQQIYSDTGDHWRKYAYGKAIGVLRRADTPITVDSVRHLKGIGPKIAAKVEEILTLGTSRKLQALQSNEEVTALREFGKIWGVGPATSKQLFAQGFRSIEQLRRRPDVLTAQQRVGLAYFEELQCRIPRAEVARIEAIVREHALRLRSALDVVVCGSFRRGAPTSGDVDILICDPTGKVHQGLLSLLVEALSAAGFLTDHLQLSAKSAVSDDPDSYMGVCQVPCCTDHLSCDCTHRGEAGLGDGHAHLHRRLDLKVYPRRMFPFALLYFTGSDYFNRSMRLYCHKLGLSLSDKALVPVVRVSKDVVHEGPLIPCNTEQEIFAALRLEYKEPWERSV